jgi:hypothetical protein
MLDDFRRYELGMKTKGLMEEGTERATRSGLINKGLVATESLIKLCTILGNS